MADPLYELLVPYLNPSSSRPPPSLKDSTTLTYLNRLSTLPVSSLTTTEPQSLSQTTHSLLISLQALSKRSHKSVVDSSTHLSTLTRTLPTIATSTASLQDALPKLDDAAIYFSENYNTRMINEPLDRRRKALLLSRNIDRVSEVLNLPTLLSSTISTSNSTTIVSTTSTPNITINYASALDLSAHVRRLHNLYPDSPLIASVGLQAEEAMRQMATNLISSLRTNSLKLASAMRTISWVRRVAPELDPVASMLTAHPISSPSVGQSSEGSLGSLFLVCRLASLQQTLSALGPLRELANQETSRSIEGKESRERNKWEGGQQTERFLKRYIEIFREQSFAIISMYKSMFPSSNTAANEGNPLSGRSLENDDPLLPLPSALSTFPLHLVVMLEHTLRHYLPNVRDRSSRDSLLTQVLYCAGSLGRLGGDFSLMLASLTSSLFTQTEEECDSDNEEWIEVTRKHRVLAGRLELLVGGKDG